MTHWTKLKKAVEEAGGTWTNREEAELFLAGAGIEVKEEVKEEPVLMDKTKPYGRVIGEDAAKPTARYTQCGMYFDKDFRKV